MEKPDRYEEQKIRMEKQLNELTLQFRRGIEDVIARGSVDENDFFSNFPRGCCGDASILLGQYLMENGIESQYVRGDCRVSASEGEAFQQSHAWLTVDGLIVDITGDQFKEDPVFLYYDKPVYVGMGDKFHNLFRIDRGSVHAFPGLENYSGACIARLIDLYKMITTLL